MTTSKPVAPTKTMTWEEFYEKSDNANKLMDRVWYCIATSEPDASTQKVFWEHWYWNNEEEASKDLVTSKKAASNHTLTIDTEDKEIDYPVWPLQFTSDSMKMYPAIDLKCCIITPLSLNGRPIMFPTNDSKKEFRVDYFNVMGKVMYFIFALDPLISDEDKSKNFDLLEKENGIKREWFHYVQWQPGYVVGSTGDPDINPK